MLASCCPNKKCEEALNLIDSIKECPKCGEAISNDFINKYETAMSFTKQKLDEMKAVSYLDVLELCLRMQDGVLHSLNVWHVKTLDSAFESAITMQKWSDALDYGINLLPGYRYTTFFFFF